MISLIIVNYNQEAYLRQAITSVLEQTKRDWELLIWDDGSTDNSVAIARQYERQDNRIKVIAAPHQGVAQARKQAIAETTGDYLGWLDSDDWLADTALAATSKVLDNNRAIGMVYTDYYDVNRQGKIQGIGKRCHIPYSPHRLLVDFMTFHFRLLRREVYDRIGGINTDCEYAYDYDLCLRLSEVTQIERIHKPLYYYRHHGQNISDRHRIEQTKSSQQAVNQALQRRGLADIYVLKIEGDRFNLGKKPSSLMPRTLPTLAKPLLKTATALLITLPFTTAIAINPAAAQQIIPNSDGTMTVVTQDGNSFNIDGGTLSGDSKNLFHSFREFGLDTGQIANFLSNPNIQNILGRINGGNPSLINGLIQVTGGNSNLFLMNPSGIIFGNNATLNVPGDFTATTATGIGFGDSLFNAVGTNDYLNLVGNPDSFNFASDESGVILNAGNLAVAEDSNISLTGGKVINTGNIETEGGNITVAAIPGTNRVRISQEGQLLSLEVPIPQNSDGEALPIQVTDLPNLLRGLPVDIDTGLAVAANDDVTVADSNTVIPNEPGTTIVSGTVDASSNTQSGDVGGEVNILGDKVGLIDADVDASGDAGGGEVLVGGDYKGQGTVPKAEVTLVDSNSTIKADALQNGDGGEVIVWSDSTTRVHGDISAKGGLNSGDGGFVETSSSGFLDVTSSPNTSATNGVGGTWLLDPHNVTIVNAIDGFNFLRIDENNPFTAIEDDALIAVGTIQNALENGSNVIVSTGTTGNQDGNITLAADLDFDGTGESTLTFEAANNIIIGDSSGQGQIFDSDTTTSTDTLNLSLIADAERDNDANIVGNGLGRVEINQPISTDGGNIEIIGRQNEIENTDDGNADGINISSPINSGGGNITLTGTRTGTSTSNIDDGIKIRSPIDSGGGDITLTGTRTGTTGGDEDGIWISSDSPINSGGGDITLTGNSNIDEGIELFSSIDSGEGNITLNSTEGAIFTGDIDSSGTTGGAINLDSATTINTGNIDSRGSNGNGGDVTLNSGEDDNIRVGSIRAEGNNNNGGDIQVNVDNDNPGLFFADNSFTNNEVPTSILTNSSSSEAIAIRHGGNGEIPFEVANPNLLQQNNPNGTVGAISGGGNSQINDGSFLFTEQRGNIRIFSVDSPEPPEPELDNNDLGNFDSKTSSPVETVATATNNLPQKLEIASIPQARTILREIERQAAQTPALVYVSFTSPEIKARTNNPDQYFARAESCLTAEYQEALGLNETQVEPTICLAAQPSDKLEILVVTPEGEPIFVPVDVTRGEVETQARKLYNEVSRGQIAWQEPALLLHEWLIRSIEEELKTREIDNLLFVLPPKLRSLPLAALYDISTDRFLIQKGYNIGLAPSINLMNTTYGKDVQQASVLALGASKFQADQHQKDLNAVEVELPQIVNLRGGQEPILNEQFTLENLQTNLDRNNVPIVHLSTHADFSTENTDDIYIQLYNQKLTLNELRSLDLQVGAKDLELLVLSACRSAFGNTDAELGFAGLAIKVGVKTAVGSLWKVSDLTTPSLMIEFYRQLQTSPFKAEALRLAQVAMRNKEITIDLKNQQMITSWGEIIELPNNVVADSLKSYIGDIRVNKTNLQERQILSIKGQDIRLPDNVVADLLKNNVRKIEVDSLDLENLQIITARGLVIELPETVVAKLLDNAAQAIDLSHPYYWSPFTVIGSPW